MRLAISIALLLATIGAADQNPKPPLEPPEATLKYHEALLKNPHNSTLYSRFHETWLDDQSIDSLTEFLKSRAKDGSKNDRAILAYHLLHRGLEEEAITALNDAITALPDDSELLLARAKILTRRLDFELAQKDLESVAASNNEPLAIEAAKLIGKSHLRQGKPAEATAAWERLLAKHPKNEEVLEDLIEITASFDQFDQAIKYANLLIESSEDPFKKIQSNIRLGELLAASNKADKAISTWSKSLSQTGEGSWLETEIIARISSHFRKLDRLDLLSTNLSELAKENPRRLHIHRELAKLEASQGDIDSAIGRFREILRRSPGNLELRDEFIRILIDSQRFDDATAELQKILTTTPNSPETHLRLADLIYQKSQTNPDIDPKTSSPEILTHLEKSLELLDPTEASGLRIATLMLRYGLEQNGETLLQKLSAAPNATSTPAETLAAEYTRTKRKNEALEILQSLAKSTDAETVLRATSAMAPITDPEIPYQILQNRLPDFPNNPSYLTALIKQSLAAKKPTEAIPSALKLLRLSKLTSEIQDTTKLATTLISAAEKTPETITQLTAIPQPSSSEICLLASLLEFQKEYEKADTLLKRNTDPTLLRFHSSLLAARGDFTTAISTLQLLSENSASYFKELSELQIRSSRTEDALATIDQWIIAAPTDKNPWIIAARLNQEKGDTTKAIDTTRRALSRFPDDEDLTASLANLYQRSGNLNQAEFLLWKLYDQAPDPTSQIRYAASLSQLALSSGRTLELKESLLLRARNNSQSLGPVLALAELARATQDNEALIEHLNQALRIKPKDPDIRIQLANTEKQNGNLAKQIAILNEGLIHDTNNRIRTTLAQAHIDNGDALKGLHILRSLAGDGAEDPRVLETTASSVADAGMFSEAIQYLQESLPHDADWRIRFVLANLLTQDGRESEAIPIFISLLTAENEIPNLPLPRNYGGFIYTPGRSISIHPSQFFPISVFMPAQLPTAPKSPEYDLNLLIQEANQSTQSLIHGRILWARSYAQALPASPREVRARSIVKLATLASSGNPDFASQIEAAKIPDLPFVIDLVANTPEGSPNLIPLIEKYPDRLDLLHTALSYNQFSTSDPKSLKILKQYLTAPDIEPVSGIQALKVLLTAEPENSEYWEKLYTILSQSVKTPDKQKAHNIQFSLYYFIIQSLAHIPEAQLPKFRESYLNFINSDNFEESQSAQHTATFLAYLKDIDAWIDAINLAVKIHQKQLSEKPPQPSQSQVFQDTLTVPSLYNIPFQSIVPGYDQAIVPQEKDHNLSYNFPLDDILKNIDHFNSPFVRAWIAFHSKDEKIIEKYLSVSPSEIEKTDFTLLYLIREIDAKNYPKACRILLDLSKLPPSQPYLTHWATINFIGTSQLLTPEQLPEFKQPLHAAIHSIAKNLPPPSWSSSPIHTELLEIAKKHQFTDLVTAISRPASPHPFGYGGRITSAGIRPRGPVTIISGSGTITRPQTPQKRIEDLAREGKHNAAAIEALNYVRNQKKSGHDTFSTVRHLQSFITPDVTKEILKLSHPGNAPGISKHLNYIDICLALREKDKALTALRALAKERPFDPTINANLAFCLPTEEADTALALLQNAARSSTFNVSINTACQNAQSLSDIKNSFALFELFSKFLENTEPETIHPQALASLSYYIGNFFNGNHLYMRTLDASTGREEKETPDAIRHREIAHKLTIAMLRHPATAESGFRMIFLGKLFKSPEELDQFARTALALEAPPSDRHPPNHFGNHNQSSANWLISRIESEGQEKMITPDFLNKLETSQPKLASLLVAFSAIKSEKDISKYWEDGTLTLDSPYTPSTLTIYDGLLSHIAKIPGSANFFISRINSLTPDDLNKNDPRTGYPLQAPLFIAALKACEHQNPDTIQKICTAISNTIFGDFSKSPDTFNNSQLNNIHSHVFNNYRADPITTVNIARAFDTTRTPFPQDYWIRNSFQGKEIADHKKALEFLNQIGLLKDSPSWKPIAITTLELDHDPFRTTKQTLGRNYLEIDITSRFDSALRQPEFIALLENRKPQTFGALITAANLSDSYERSRLYAKAFKHAAPYLAKASPKHLEDFELLIPFLPPESIPSLPESLQQKARELHEVRMADYLAAADRYLAEIPSQPTNNPFSKLLTPICQIAPYDLEKAADIFLRGDALYEKNSQSLYPEESNFHEEALTQVIDSLGYRDANTPESALLFYRQIRNSPRANRFSITGRNFNYFLVSIGQSLADRNTSDKIPFWIKPWLEVENIPKELQNEALAAITAYAFENNISFPDKDISKELNKHKLSKKSRELITACAIRYNWDSKKEDEQNAAAKTFLALLTDPTLPLDFRTQLAFSMNTSVGILLAHPSTAETITSLITDYCETDHSILNTNLSSYLCNIGSSNFMDTSLPQLKTINQAFWKNANSPKPRGHRAIDSQDASRLFMTAVRIKDKDAIDHLFPHVRTTLFGNLDAISFLLNNNHSDLAAKLIPDQNSPFYYNRSTLPSPGLDQKINELCETLNNPEQALRLRANMVRLYRQDGTKQKETKAYIKNLTELYRKSPPKNPSTKIEILGYIATSLNPAEAVFQNEISELAASLDLKKTIRTLITTPDRNANLVIQPQHEFQILHQAAMIQLYDGDPSLFISLCNEFSTYAKNDSSEAAQRLTSSFSDHPYDSPLDSFCIATPQWIALAVAHGKTDSFQKLIQPLRNLTLSFAESKHGFQYHLYAALAIHSFISHWENQPEDLTPLITNNANNDYTVKRFTTLHDGIPFFNLLRDTGFDSEHLQFVTAVLSRQSLTPILLSRYSYPGLPHKNTDEIPQLIANLPDTLSPTGKLLVRYQRASTISIPKDTLEPYRALIRDTPNTPEWLRFNINSKLNLITKILHTNSDVTEARTIIDSIDSNTLPESQKIHYQTMLERIKSAEQKRK